MTIETLCEATKKSLENLKKNGCNYNGHQWVELFQQGLCDNLTTMANGYNWSVEAEISSRNEGDRIDVYGHCTTQSDWIIEIDATRADQVAKKILSRFALWGMSGSIEYVAILYPNTQNGKAECEKYLRYGYDIIKTINQNSNVTGIFINPVDNSIEVLSFNERSHFEVNGHDCKSMSEAVAKAISIYLAEHSVTYADLTQRFDKYVNNEKGKSRYKDIKRTTADGVPVFTYTQFRQYGTASYWNEFVKLCKKHKINIVRKKKMYVGEMKFEYK